MSSREVLIRSVLRQGSSNSDSPFGGTDLSPMSSLALSFHNTTSLNNGTPRRKLSLNSVSSNDSPISIRDSSLLHNTSTNSDSLNDSALMSPPATSTCMMSPPLLVSPTRKTIRNKENFPSPYFSPSHSSIPHRLRTSPLKDVQNTVNRNLTFSPMKKQLQLISPSKRAFASPHKPSPPEDFDTNSQDSGYSESGKKFEDSCFSVPVNCAPRKLNLDLSPPKEQTLLSPPKSQSAIPNLKSITGVSTSALTVISPMTSRKFEERKPFRSFKSYSSKGDEEDAMLMELMNESPSKDDSPQLTGFSNLLSAPIHKQKADQTPNHTPSGIKRCLSLMNITPVSSRVESLTNENSTEIKSIRFKRPEAPTDLSHMVECKRRRENEPSPLNVKARVSPLAQRQASAPETNIIQKPKFMRSHSESQVSEIKAALNKSSSHVGELTGDFSQPIALPIIEGGKHPDLKSISADTMANLLRGNYANQIGSFKIIDCRYTYEYKGGHIVGAELFHHPRMIIDHLAAQKGAPTLLKEGQLRDILIFHCEFSAERGPKGQRLLREIDRTTNKEHYPKLYFPETYLLEGGYKAFYESYPEFCTPMGYVKMLDANHTEDLKLFRSKSKSWQAENKQSKNRNTLPRTGLKRLAL